MQPCLKILISIFFISSLSACTGIKPQHQLPPEAITYIDEVDTYLIVDQDEIYADIKGSNMAAAAGGGLLFALIDLAVESSQTSTAETSIQPVRDHLLDYDYAEVLQNHINNKISEVDRFTIVKAKLERSISSDLYATKHSESEASAVLFLQADYSVSPDFSSVQTKVIAFMFPNSETLNAFKEVKDSNQSHVDLEDNIYHNVFTQSQLLNNSAEMEKNLSEINQNPELIKLALEKNAELIASQIKSDLQN